ncbi:hypothetical protein BD626DRAFT_30481 [Schizophyllum amplum]|uniref:Uncharacterized protein n=1 Tax=Schizophyllum amplum TaxID=97359 RepID=A0A550D0I6_9AGAR|nr:hypothetical protein BD626DRAFT_30481 [Auriculariopsis ampla]
MLDSVGSAVPLFMVPQTAQMFCVLDLCAFCGFYTPSSPTRPRFYPSFTANTALHGRLPVIASPSLIPDYLTALYALPAFTDFLCLHVLLHRYCDHRSRARRGRGRTRDTRRGRAQSDGRICRRVALQTFVPGNSSFACPSDPGLFVSLKV